MKVFLDWKSKTISGRELQNFLLTSFMKLGLMDDKEKEVYLRISNELRDEFIKDIERYSNVIGERLKDNYEHKFVSYNSITTGLVNFFDFQNTEV